MQMRFGSPKYWEQRAEEARVLAESIAEPEAKREMLIVVASCERLAKLAEVREAREAGVNISHSKNSNAQAS